MEQKNGQTLDVIKMIWAKVNAQITKGKILQLIIFELKYAQI